MKKQNSIKNKRSVYVSVLLVLALYVSTAMLLAGCGGGSGSSVSENTYNADAGYAGDGTYADSQGAAAYDENGAYDEDADAAGSSFKSSSDTDQEVSAEETADGAEAPASDDAGEKAASASKVKKEMLVYRGNVSVDTLDFEKSVSDFKKLLEKADGFVETENYSDDGGYSGYYIDETEDRHSTYTATVRVPSSKYQEILENTGDLGDVRSQSSNAENVTQRYGTYQSELAVYQAQYDRYMKLLKETKNDDTALKLQDKLFELQVKIADIKSNLTNIETDVAYSYLNMTIREVRKYQDAPAKTDTFFDRLKNTCRDSWDTFLAFMEGVLFLVIRLWYYVVIVGVIVYFIRKHHKKKKEKRRRKAEEKEREWKAQEEAESRKLTEEDPYAIGTGPEPDEASDPGHGGKTAPENEEREKADGKPEDGTRL